MLNVENLWQHPMRKNKMCNNEECKCVDCTCDPCECSEETPCGCDLQKGKSG